MLVYDCAYIVNLDDFYVVLCPSSSKSILLEDLKSFSDFNLIAPSPYIIAFFYS